MNNEKILKFLEHFSVITVGESKIPNFPWKKCQTEKLSKEQLLKQWNYKGGKWYKDSEGNTLEIPATTGFGIVTGFEDLEVIDIDLKVFSTAQEKKDFWEEYLQNLQDNILDFDSKFVIYKSMNEGFHILYKSKRVQGNLKLAKLKGHERAIIETRGKGGYIFVYPENRISAKSYFEIDYISDQDREVIMSFSKMYDYVEELPEEPKKDKKVYASDEIPCWEDFNNKTDIWDVISDDFTIPRGGNKAKHIVIKRHGATSPHSGYIFKDSGCMYLFSTGTIYPHEKLITPFLAYAYKNHNGDLSAAAKDLYQQGYGSRLKKKVVKKAKEISNQEDVIIDKTDLNFPIDIFPKPIQNYILECNRTLDSSIDYMGCSLLWLISVCVGNSINIKVKNGWHEPATVWISIVGDAGVGKTPSISSIINPLLKVNNREIKRYIQELEKYRFYESLSPKDKKDYPEVPKPLKSQFIANDITLEALVDLHQQNPNAVGVFKDELAGWIKDMNKYRAGSDLEFWLSSWSGKPVTLTRVTRPDSYVNKPLIPVLGGIQPSVFNQFATEENKDNGFLDRLLLCFPDIKVEKYNENEMDYDVIEWYNNAIVSFYDTIKLLASKNTSEGELSSLNAYFDPDAKKEWVRMFNEITQIQNSDEENEYMKSMLPKQKSYIPRFALLIHVFDSFFQYDGYDSLKITKDSVLKAEKLSKYFIANAKKIKIVTKEVSDLKKSAKEGKTNFDKLRLIYEENPDFNRSQVANILGISRQQVLRLLSKIKENEV
jgi:hypothetical protein